MDTAKYNAILASAWNVNTAATNRTGPAATPANIGAFNLAPLHKLALLQFYAERAAADPRPLFSVSEINAAMEIAKAGR